MRKNMLSVALIGLLSACAATAPKDPVAAQNKSRGLDKGQYEVELLRACQGGIVIETHEVPHSELLSVIVATRLKNKGCRVVSDRTQASHALRIVGFYKTTSYFFGSHISADVANFAWYQYQKTHAPEPSLDYSSAVAALGDPQMMTFALEASGMRSNGITYAEALAKHAQIAQSMTVHGILAPAKDPDSQHPVGSWKVTASRQSSSFEFLPLFDDGLNVLFQSLKVPD